MSSTVVQLATALVEWFKGNKKVSIMMTEAKDSLIVTAQSGFFNQTSKKTLKDSDDHVLLEFDANDVFEVTVNPDDLVAYSLRGLWVNRLAPLVKEGRLKPEMSGDHQLVKLDATTKDGGTTKQLRTELVKTQATLAKETRNLLVMLGVSGDKVTDQVIADYLGFEEVEQKMEFVESLKQ
jgi:hypothetical protein